MNNHILSLLGLALRGGRLAVGEEPAALAAKTGQARLLLAASDAAGNTLRRAEHLAQQGHCLWLTLPFSKEELGGALGRGSAAIVALTDTGLAAAVTERLAAQDPERYAEAAARMDLKRRRAKERQSAPRPPRKAPPPSRKNRREGEAGNRHVPKGHRGPEDRRDGGHASRPYRGGKRPPGDAGTDRPHGGKPKDRRFQDSKPGGSRSQDRRGKGRPFKNRGGPPSGGGRPMDRGR